jgi:tetratricopeptide (TPR) repeat protein
MCIASSWVLRPQAFGVVVAPAPADDAEMCDQGKGEASIAACGRLIKRNPKDAVAYANRGSGYHYKGDYDRAIADLDQVIRLDPKLAVAHDNHGLTLRYKHKYDRAIADYDQAIRLDPKDASAYVGRGDAYSDKGDYRLLFK